MATDAERLARFEALEEEIILYGQAVSAEGDQFTRASLPYVGEMIERLRTRIEAGAVPFMGRSYQVISGRR